MHPEEDRTVILVGSSNDYQLYSTPAPNSIFILTFLMHPLQLFQLLNGVSDPRIFSPTPDLTNTCYLLDNHAPSNPFPNFSFPILFSFLSHAHSHLLFFPESSCRVRILRFMISYLQTFITLTSFCQNHLSLRFLNTTISLLSLLVTHYLLAQVLCSLTFLTPVTFTYVLIQPLKPLATLQFLYSPGTCPLPLKS